MPLYQDVLVLIEELWASESCSAFSYLLMHTSIGGWSFGSSSDLSNTWTRSNTSWITSGTSLLAINPIPTTAGIGRGYSGGGPRGLGHLRKLLHKQVIEIYFLFCDTEALELLLLLLQFLLLLLFLHSSLVFLREAEQVSLEKEGRERREERRREKGREKKRRGTEKRGRDLCICLLGLEPCTAP